MNKKWTDPLIKRWTRSFELSHGKKPKNELGEFQWKLERESYFYERQRRRKYARRVAISKLNIFIRWLNPYD
jgi:hypothetical protein